MLLGKSTAAAALLVSMLVPAVASAQYGDSGESARPTINAFGHVGVAQILKDLNVEKTSGLKGGIAFGGGVGMQFNPNLGIRATVDFNQAEGEGVNNSPIFGTVLNRTFVGVDMQVRAVTERGILPYFALGIGSVTVGSDADDYDGFTKGAGKFGFGVEYMPKSGSLSFYGQNATYVYEYSSGTFERWQTDMIWSAGVKYRINK